MYAIRPAIARDLPLLPAIELAAAAQFRQSLYPHMAEAPLASAHIDLASDLVWVAHLGDELVAFIIIRMHAAAAHIQEIDVHPQFARQGIGAALIRAVCASSREQGIHFVTLTTFDNVPWNAPYYARLGFSFLPPVAWTDALKAVRRAEEQAGLDMDHRVCMQLRLE